jgi:hypothetical protein
VAKYPTLLAIIYFFSIRRLVRVASRAQQQFYSIYFEVIRKSILGNLIATQDFSGSGSACKK